MSSPDTITIISRDEEEISADSADLLIQIEGSSLFSGDEAFKKAAEVRVLVEQLKEVGVDENSIKLRSVDINSSAFSLLKSSSVKYWIKIRNVSLAQLPKVLGAIGDQKNCSMNRLDWIYSTSEQVRTSLRSKVLRRALSTAKEDASCLGVSLLGIHSLTEEFRDNRQQNVSSEHFGMTDNLSLKAKRSRSVDLDFALGNSTKLTVILRTVFRVSAMSESQV